MQYLYGAKRGGEFRLVATFSSEVELLAYVHWANVPDASDRYGRFEPTSALAGYEGWEYSDHPLTSDDPAVVVHNPTPNAS
jgi:hypothetical protein